MHECQIEREIDQFSGPEQYLIRCKCHMGTVWKIWQPGDPPFVCPEEGNHDTTNNMSSPDK